MDTNQLRLASEHPIRMGGLQFALCAAEENFNTAEWLERRREQDEWYRTNGAEARRSMAHHHCGIGLEFVFKVLRDIETIDKGGTDDDKRTSHVLVDALGKISTNSDGLQSLYAELCAGQVVPIAICVGEPPEHVDGANLDTLHGFCEYADQLGKWATARYDHWEEEGVWMYRVADLAPVLAFGKAAADMANREQKDVALRLLKTDEKIHVSPDWTQVAMPKERSRTHRCYVTLTPSPLPPDRIDPPELL